MLGRLLWRAVAAIVTRPAVAAWLIRRAQRTPYYHIMSRDGTALYMERFWLFNPYGKDDDRNQTPARWPRLPSIRAHHICLPDDDDHEHTHPWLCRTTILRHWYKEERREEYAGARLRVVGDTHPMTPSVCHRIVEVAPGGAWTLFITWGESQGWGFKVDGNVVPWRKYLDGKKS